MRKIKIIFIFAFLFMPFVARAAEPTEFRCYCDYKWSVDVAKCENKDFLTVKLGKEWEVSGGWKPATGGKKVFGDVFSDKAQCQNLLEAPLKTGVICGDYSCVLQANFPTKGSGAGGNVITEDNWEQYNGLKWLTNVAPPNNPIKVTEGDTTSPIEIAASAMTSKNVIIECTNCADSAGGKVGPGLEFKSKPGSGKGEATIIWDTSKTDKISDFYIIEVKAFVEGEPDQSIPGELFFSITGVTPVQTKEDIDAWIKSQYGVPEGYVERGGALPRCAFDGSCRSVNDLLQLIINFASGMFMILGSFAFAFFVYGGFKMIISMGNAEMVETGKKTMIAAALGLVVAMVAYAAIDLMLDILNVNMEFRGIK